MGTSRLYGMRDVAAQWRRLLPSKKALRRNWALNKAHSGWQSAETALHIYTFTRCENSTPWSQSLATGFLILVGSVSFRVPPSPPVLLITPAINKKMAQKAVT